GIDPDGRRAQPRRSRQMAAADHELPELLWPDARPAAPLDARRDPRGAVSRLVADDGFQLLSREPFRRLALVAEFDRDMAVLLREAEIAIRKSAVADEFLKRLEFVAFPVRIVEIFVEDDDRARTEPRCE